MKSKRISFRLPFLLLLTIAATVIRSIAIFRDLDYKYGYFNSHTLISVSSWLTVGAILFLTVIAVIDVKQERLTPTYHTPATYVPVCIVCTALAFMVKELFTRFSSYLEIRDTLGAAGPALVFSFIAGLLATASIASFFLFTFYKSPSENKRAVALVVISFFAVLYAAYLYFTTELPLNAPNKIVDQTAYTVCAIFFLYEARASLGRPIWRAYTVFGQAAALLCAYSSIPALAVYFIDGKVISNSIYESILTFALFIFIGARLILFTELESSDDCETVRAIKDIAKEATQDTQVCEEVTEADEVESSNVSEEISQ